MKSKIRRISCVCLSAVLSCCLAASSALAFAKDKQVNPVLDTASFTDVTGKVDLSSVTLKNLNDNVLKNAGLSVKSEKKTVIVTLKADCVMDDMPEEMSVAEYLATYQGSKALRAVNKNQDDFLNSLSSLGVKYSVVNRYNTVTNAVAIEVDTAELSRIKSIASVKYAVVSQTYSYPENKVLTYAASGTENPSNIYATGIYDSSVYLNQYDGTGMTVAVLDTGLDYTHEAFQKMPSEEGLSKSELSDKLSEKQFNAVSLSAAKGKNVTADDLYVNAKVPFAYDYADKDTDVYPAYSQHGVHVAGIVAGDAASYTDKDGEVAKDENGNVLEFKGVAPNAQLVICKVFTDDFDSPDLGGAKSEDVIAALEDCVLLGVDVINMSLGTTAGFSTTYLEGDSEGLALARVHENIQKAGISLVCAASNDFSSGFGSAFGTNLASNPDSGTVGSPSTFIGSLSVASINGQLAPFMIANEESVVYYSESSDQNSVRFDFAKLMLGGATKKTFKYVVVPGVGRAGDYTEAVRRELTPVSEGGNKKEGEKVIAVIRRGSNTFQDKVKLAKLMNADAVIIYNNVAGTVGISLGDMEDPIPTASVSMDAGNALCYENGTRRLTGEIEINVGYQAGPFMNDYSSWGTTPDLKIKPEITAHGGEITSTVSGGYDEMSGTSMASPNLAGFAALLRSKIKSENPDKSSVWITRRVNQIIMSTATTVYDQEGKPYSPRKQGAGLATLANVFETQAFLYTDESNGGAEDNRPKIELGEDEKKTGVYKDMTFFVSNFGSSPLTFKTKSIFMTETISSDGLSVAEKAHLLDGAAQWRIERENGALVAEGGDGTQITVPAGESFKIKVTLTLSQEEKDYIDRNFVNGMFVEGFLQLISSSEQCDLTLPFMGFYGDWEAAPMLDYDCYEISDFKQDTSYTDETRPQEQVWATQAFGTYYNQEMSVPLGSFAYIQDEDADQIYTEEEYTAISRYNIYNGENDTSNYMTTDGFRALYAGLLRNAEIVTYDLYNENTGELILQDCAYRVSKAYANGGSSVPANVKLDLPTEELGLVNNGKYRFDFKFYFSADDVGGAVPEENTFSMSFYADYEAPVLADSRIRYYDYKDNNVEKQKVYLDLDVYDNHYPQAVVLCYSENENDQDTLFLATEYVTPVYNATKNGITTVSIEVTDFYEKYQNRLFVQIDDYALNHSVYQINFSSSQSSPLPSSFELEGKSEITLGVNETYKAGLKYEGTANISNFNWRSSSPRIAQVKNGEIFGVSPGTAIVTVRGGGGSYKQITVRVTESDTQLRLPALSFGAIENSSRNLVKATGTVDVNAGKQFKLDLVADPWYYPVSTLNIQWSSSDTSVATVDNEGNVTTLEKRGNARIIATVMREDGSPSAYSAVVTLSVQEPFKISGSRLTDYNGWGGDNGVVYIPDDKNVMTIGEEAFKDNDNIRVIVIPKTVTQIEEHAFQNCTALEEVYFIQETPLAIPDANLSLILNEAFVGCTSLRKVDLSNVKTITVGSRVFKGCTSLEEIVKMEHVGTMYDEAFAGCTSLTSINIADLHNTGRRVFADCTSLESVHTAYYSSIGEAMFEGCTALESIEINCPVVSDGAFYGCSALKSVKFGTEPSVLLKEFTIGASAFNKCMQLEKVDFNGYGVNSIGDTAFADCFKLRNIEIPEGAKLGVRVFENAPVDKYPDDNWLGAIYSGNTLVYAPAVIGQDFEIREGTTEIGAYAFAESSFAQGYTLEIPETVVKIGEGAFNRSNLAAVAFKGSSSVEEIGAYAFEQSLLGAVNLPATVTEIGAYAFANCFNLDTVTFAGSRGNELGLGAAAFYGCRSLENITLPNLAAENGAVTLAGLAFYGCVSLEQADIANATALGEFAFAGTALKEIDLKNATVIGAGAFENCKTLATVSGMRNVTAFGDGAFYDTALETLDISGAVSIGEYAFYGNAESRVTIGAKLETLGGGAFAGSPNLTAFAVEEGTVKFFVEDGVLYRNIEGGNGGYELCAYPSAKRLNLTGGVRSYTVKEGTVNVLDYAFEDIVVGAVDEVRLPYSVKVIGVAAFYNSGITSYVFESIEAPVLLTEYYDNSSANRYYNLYYLNFQDSIVLHVNGGGAALKISYPENGAGYDNYVYGHYFTTKVSLGELMDDTTRSLKNVIEGFASAETVAGWNKLDKNEANTAMVTNFSDAVKRAHATLNTIKSEKQLELLGSANVEKLYAIESALKPVKEYFGIKVAISSLEIAADSAHKTEYKAGEKFDLTGLKITVTYDDYSTEAADMSKVKLVSGYDVELTVNNRYVQVEYEGNKLQVRITVTDDGNGEDNPPVPPPETSGCGGCGSTTLGGGTGGFIGLALVACALAVIAVVKRKRAD